MMELKNLLEKLELQDNLLTQNEIELLNKTENIFELEREVKRYKQKVKQGDLAIKEMEKSKERLIKEFEESFNNPKS